MPIDLEKEIIEIKVTLGRIEEKLKDIPLLGESYDALEERIRELEGWKNKAIGYAAGVSAVISVAIAIIVKFL